MAFAALRRDGTCVAWGMPRGGGKTCEVGRPARGSIFLRCFGSLRRKHGRDGSKGPKNASNSSLMIYD